jgi:hypothetical protein
MVKQQERGACLLAACLERKVYEGLTLLCVSHVTGNATYVKPLCPQRSNGVVNVLLTSAADHHARTLAGQTLCNAQANACMNIRADSTGCSSQVSGGKCLPRTASVTATHLLLRPSQLRPCRHSAGQQPPPSCGTNSYSMNQYPHS